MAQNPSNMAELAQDPTLGEYGLMPEQDGVLPSGPVAQSFGEEEYDEVGDVVYDNIIEEFGAGLSDAYERSGVHSVNAEALSAAVDQFSRSTQDISDKFKKIAAQEGPVTDEDRHDVMRMIEHIPKAAELQEVMKHMHRQWITGLPFVPHFIHERKPGTPDYKKDKKGYEEFWGQKYYSPREIKELKTRDPNEAIAAANRQDNGVMRYARGIQDFARGATDVFMGVFDNIQETKSHLGPLGKLSAQLSPSRLFKTKKEDADYLKKASNTKFDPAALLTGAVATAVDAYALGKLPQASMAPMMVEAVLHPGAAIEKNPLAHTIGRRMAVKGAKNIFTAGKGALTGNLKGVAGARLALKEKALFDKSETHQKRMESAYQGGHAGAIALAKNASKMANSKVGGRMGGVIKATGNLILQSQRQGVLGMGFGKRFAGLEVTPEIQKAIIALEREAREKPMEVADFVNRVREIDPDAFAIVFDAINEGQAVAPQMYNLLKDMAEVRSKTEKVKEKHVGQMVRNQAVKAEALLEGAQKSEMLPLEQAKYGLVKGRMEALKRPAMGKPQAKYRRGERARDAGERKYQNAELFIKRFEDALSSKNGHLIDMLRREAVGKGLLDKKAATGKKGRAGRAKKILGEGFDYNRLARQIEEYNSGLVNFKYEGKDMRGLDFIVDGLRPENFDPSKVKSEIAFERAENPKLYDALAGRMDVLIQTRRYMDEFSRDLALLEKDPKKRKLLEESVFLENVLGGYVPTPKTTGAKQLSGGRTGGDAFREHLLLAKEKREMAKDWAGNILERAEGDQGAWQALLNYTLAATNTITKAKLHKSVAESLGKHDKIFDNKAEFVRATGLPETAVKTLDLHRQGRLGHDTWQMVKRGVPFEWVEVSKSKDPLLPMFGRLEGKVIPKHVYHHLANYDAAYGAVRESGRVLQNIFKQSKTIYGLPYYLNTALGLAVLQGLDGGSPLELMKGIVEYGKKGRVYEALRDAGGIRESAMLLGIDAPKQNVFGQLAKVVYDKAKKKSVEPGVLPPSLGQGGSRVRAGAGSSRSFSKFLVKLYEGWQDPVQMKLAKKYGVPAAAVALGGVVGGAATSGLAGGVALGVLNGLAATRGKRLSMLMDQGARIASATRLISQYAELIALKMAEARGKKSSKKQKKIDIEKATQEILKDKTMMRKISALADKANIDYTLLPMSVEHFSAAGPISPFIKFATRATELLVDSPGLMPKRFLQLNEAERQYLSGMTPEQRKFYDNMPWGEQQMGYLPRSAGKDGNPMNYWSAAYWNPLTMAVARESMPLVTMAGGWFGGASPWSQAEAFKAETSNSATRLLNYGWLKPIVEAYGKGETERGVKLRTQKDKLKHIGTAAGPSGFFRFGQLREIPGNVTGKTNSGVSELMTTLNAVGVRHKAVSEVSKQKGHLASEYDKALKALKRDRASDLSRSKNNPTERKIIVDRYDDLKKVIVEAYNRARESKFLTR